MNEEIWKEIEGYNGKYFISNMGNFKITNFKNKGEIKISQGHKAANDGYHRVQLRTRTKDNSKVYGKAFLLHRLVALHFLKPSIHKDQKQVNHKDGNKSNNCVSNLEWVNAYENTHHAWKTGLTDNKGEENG